MNYLGKQKAIQATLDGFIVRSGKLRNRTGAVGAINLN